MTRRCLLLLLGFIATTATVAIVAFYPIPPRHRINETSVHLIQKGMTQAEVEIIFGAPPGKYAEEGRRLHFGSIKRVGRIESWLGEEVTAEVSFDSSGKVSRAYVTAIRSEWSKLAKILRWFGM